MFIPFGKNAVRGMAVIVFSLLVGGLMMVNSRVDAQRRKPAGRKVSAPKPSKYSEFNHATRAHQMACSSCHNPFPSTNWKTVRSTKDGFPDITDYPHHESCLKCHQQQFFRGARPEICSICHTNPSPRDSSRHPFPNPREIFDQSPKGKKAGPSDMVVAFPHDKHVDIVTASTHSTKAWLMNAAYLPASTRTMAEESCAVCHQTMKPQGDAAEEYLTKPPVNLGDSFWLKKGTFKSAPIGHTSCFTCHSADTGILPAPENCAGCHRLRPPQPPSDFDPKLAKAIGFDDKVMMQAWESRHSSGTFRHEWFSHAEVACATCHNINTMNTADPNTTKVTIASCASCHATKTSDDGGALNYEIDKRKEDPRFECAKCHVAFGKLPIPASHTQALSRAASGK
ncbi:MAG: hypothetical protein JO053_08250 [Acidobacteria bacterium]|nr:hypothetical protein [Acidobacteriota bacterium]